MEPIKEFSKTVLTLENCLVPREKLLNTPSEQDGVSHELEVDLRLVGSEYIQTAGLLLKLPQVAMATAQVLFHRFYYSKSFVKYSLQPLAMACIFVAAKIEEDCRRIRDVINVFHHLRQKNSGKSPVPMDYMGDEYFKLKATVIKYERFLLKELGFCVHVKHPHKLIITYLQMLEMEKNTVLAQKSWNFMNDSLRTNVFVRFTPETIACACIFLAARELQIPLPQSPPWWLLFDANYEDIEEISLELLSLYRRPKVSLEQLEKRISVHKEELQKKQVEIKEVKLKKAESEPASKKGLLPTPGTGPSSNKPSRPHPSADQPAPKLSPASSDVSRSQPPDSKEPDSLAPPETANSVKAQSPLSSRSASPHGPQTVTTGSSQDKAAISPVRWKGSPASDGSDSESRTPSPIRKGNTPRAYRPVISPIILSGDSESAGLSPSSSPHLSALRRENGLDGTSRDRSHDRKVRKSKSRHKHRGERRERRRARSRSWERKDQRREHHHSRGREREREREEREKERMKEKERERERERERWRDRDSYLYDKRDRDYGYEHHSRRRDPYRR